MTLLEMKEQVLFQTGSDAADLADVLPHLLEYLNDGYDRLLTAYTGAHVSADGDHPPLRHDKSEPDLPAWAHAAVADWATWCMYRNGASARQSRGYAFRAAFEDAERRLRGMQAGKYFGNIPR